MISFFVFNAILIDVSSYTKVEKKDLVKYNKCANVLLISKAVNIFFFFFYSLIWMCVYLFTYYHFKFRFVLSLSFISSFNMIVIQSYVNTFPCFLVYLCHWLLENWIKKSLVYSSILYIVLLVFTIFILLF